MTNKQAEIWERALWKKQNYPDNFVGPSFFRVHTKNHKVFYSQAFYGSILLTQELCSCVGLVTIFFGISDNPVNAPIVLFGTVLFTIIGYCIIHSITIKEGKSDSKSFVEELKVTLFTIVLSWFSSPIIKTLTASVATDSINACTIALLILHLAIHPYGADVAIVNSTMSHNLGLFASVCLASRLENNLDVFVLMIVAVVFFNLLPTFRNFCQDFYGRGSIYLLTSVMFIGCLMGLYFFASSLLGIFIVILVFLNGVAPVLFIYLQSHRKNIYGPWDEAFINEKK